MQNVLLVIHIIACIVMTAVIMLQKSEGGALGIGGGGGGLMTGRGAAGALVRVTMIVGAVFFITSLGLTTLANRGLDTRSDVERQVDAEERDAEGSTGTDLGEPLAPLLEEVDPAPALEDGNEQIAPALDDIAPSSETGTATEPVDNPQ